MLQTRETQTFENSRENTIEKKNIRKKKKPRGKAVIIVLCMLFLCCAAVGGLFLMKSLLFGNSEKEQSREAFYRGFSEDEIEYEEEMRFVDSRLLLTAADDTPYTEVEKLIKEINAEIIGYIPLTGDYQILFNEKKSYRELLQAAQELTASGKAVVAIPEYVIQAKGSSVAYTTDPWVPSSEPKDKSGGKWNIYDPDGANWWAEAILMPKVWSMDQEFAPVHVGLIDAYFDSGNQDLASAFAADGIIGQDGINVSSLYANAKQAEQEGQKKEYSSGTVAHGTVDAGIIAARNNGSGICGISQNAVLYGVSLYGNSEMWNISVMSLKYGIAVLLEKDVKVINISMGDEMLIFASQQEASGNDSRTQAALETLQIESRSMESFLKRCLEKYDFLITKSAGNTSGYDYVQVEPDEEYPYGYRSAISSDPQENRIKERCDAKYDIFGAITDAEVAEHILMVGAVDLERNTYTESSAPTDTVGSMPSNAVTDTTVDNGSSRRSQWYEFGITDFSNTGSRVDLYAPGGSIKQNGETTGVQILSTYPAEETGYMQGTSQAAPMAAGTAALIWGINPSLSATQVRQIMLSSAEDRLQGGDHYSFLNAYAAVLKARETKAQAVNRTEQRALLLGYAYILEKEDGEFGIELIDAEITIISKADGTQQIVELEPDKTFSLFLDKGEYIIKARAENYPDTTTSIIINDEKTYFVPVLLEDEYKLILTSDLDPEERTIGDITFSWDSGYDSQTGAYGSISITQDGRTTLFVTKSKLDAYIVTNGSDVFYSTSDSGNEGTVYRTTITAEGGNDGEQELFHTNIDIHFCLSGYYNGKLYYIKEIDPGTFYSYDLVTEEHQQLVENTTHAMRKNQYFYLTSYSGSAWYPGTLRVYDTEKGTTSVISDNFCLVGPVENAETHIYYIEYIGEPDIFSMPVSITVKRCLPDGSESETVIGELKVTSIQEMTSDGITYMDENGNAHTEIFPE